MGNSKSKGQADEDGAVVEDEIGEGDDQQQAAARIHPAEDAKLRKQVSCCFKSMKKSPSNVTKQRKALGKLRLYCNAAPPKSKRSIHHILDLKGQTLIEKAMQSHRKMAALQSNACRVVALLARADPKATLGAVPLVLEAMRTHKRNANLQCNGLSAISFWGTAKDTTVEPAASLATPVVEEGAYPVLFRMMLSAWHEFNPVVQDKALKTLVILTGSAKENRTAFVCAQAWRVLQACQKNYGNKPKVQLKVIKILRYIALDHPSAVHKRLDLVLTAMKTHVEDAAIQRAGCAVLLLLATHHPASHSALLEQGGGRDAILVAMQQHASNEDIQKTAILCLQKLPHQEQAIEQPTNGTNDNNNNPPPTPTFDAITQGLEAMITTLSKDETTAQSSTNICKALIKLAVESHTNKLDIANANGVEAIVIAMKRHADAPSMQRYGCQALGQLAAVEATKRAIVQTEGVPVVARAIVSHSGTTHLVALHGMVVLVKLAQVMDNHKALLEAPIVPPLVQAMKFHMEYKTIQHKAMVVLNKLAARYPRAKLPMVKAGSLQAILQAMTQFSEDIAMQKMGCLCLLNLHHVSTSWAVVQAGSLQVVVASMERHGTSIGMQLTGLRTIAEITQFSCHLNYWAIQMGGLRCLVVALQNFKDHSGFYEMAFGVLMKSSKTPQLRQTLVQAGGISVVLAGMKIHHPAHPFIQQSGFKTLYNLSSNSIHHGAIIFRKGGWRVVRHAQVTCPDDPTLQKHGWTLMAQLLVMFLMHWSIWALYHVFNYVPTW